MIERPIYPTDLSEDQVIMQLIGAAKRHELFGIMSAHSILRRQLCLYLLISMTFCSGPTKPDEIPPPITALKYDQEPNWSPNGDVIAFYRGRKEPGVSGLYLMNSDGSDLRYLVPRGRAPKWSPQGDRILYRIATDNQIYIYDVASDSSSAITSDNHQNIDPAWFPDGESIVYSIRVGSDSTAGIWKLNLTTSSARRIIQLWGRYPSISLSGTYITFIEEVGTGSSLSIANVYPDSIGNITRLVSGSQINTPYMQYPSFNNTGTNILFQADNEVLYEPRLTFRTSRGHYSLIYLFTC